jgi:broad-specificity NMP kinase
MKLIIINGPTGVGKTTLAKQLKEKLPMSLYIYFDELRRMIGQYRENRDESRVYTFELAFAMMRVAFEKKRDVLIDKIMYDRIEEELGERTIDIITDLGKKYNADIYEFILWADKETVMKRLEERGQIVGGLLTKEKAEMFWEEMNMFKDERKEAQIIDTSNLSSDDVFEAVWKKVSQSEF